MVRDAQRLLPLALALVLLCPLAAGAAPEKSMGDLLQARLQAERKKGLRFHFRHMEVDRGDPGQALDPESGPKRLILTGDVRCETKEGARIRIYADGMVVWGEIGSLGEVLDAVEMYAEGNVLMVAFGDTFEGDALYLDLAEGEGRIVNATVRSSGEATGGSPLLVRAERARVWNGLTSFEGRGAVVSTCTYHEPHFALAADCVRVNAHIDEIAKVEEGVGASSDLDVDGPSFEVYGVPVPLWLPPWNTAWNRFVPQVTPGSSGRFGLFGLGEMPLYQGRSLEAHGTVNVYQRRGTGLGGGGSWHGPARDIESYFGFIEVFSIHDRADTDTSTRLPVPDEGRLRVRGFHRDDLPFGLRREAEVSYLSDRALLPEYFEKESKQGKEQETVLYGRWLHDNMGANIQGRFRLNDFQTQAEYLPRGRFFWIGEPFLERILPFGRGVYLTSAIEVSNVRQRFDEDTLLPSTRVQRFDLEKRLDWPFPVGPLQIDPFVLGRYSAWSTGLDRSNLDIFAPRPDRRAVDRWVAGGGAIATTDLWRDFGDVRHVMTPSVGYTNVFHVDTAPGALFPIDSLEAVRKAEFIPLGFRNRIQLWSPASERPADVLDWDVTTRVFARPDRDNAGDRLGPLRSDLRVLPLPVVGGRWRSDWDLNRDGGLFRSDAEVWFRPQGDVQVGAAHRFFEGTYRAVEGSIDARLTEKWSVRVQSQYDFEQDRFTNNRLTLVRWFHRFVLDAAIDADFGENDVRFAVHFMPIELYGSGDAYGGDMQRRQDPLF